MNFVWTWPPVPGLPLTLICESTSMSTVTLPFASGQASILIFIFTLPLRPLSLTSNSMDWVSEPSFPTCNSAEPPPPSCLIAPAALRSASSLSDMLLIAPLVIPPVIKPTKLPMPMPTKPLLMPSPVNAVGIIFGSSTSATRSLRS